jgi:hypothetical protein
VERSPLGPNNSKLLKNFTMFHGTRKFITVFTRARSGPYPEPDKFRLTAAFCFSKINFYTIPHLRLSLPSGLFPSDFHTKTLHVFLFSPMRDIYPVLFILIGLIILIISSDECKLWSSSLFSFLQDPVTSSLLSQIILLSTLFSNTLNLCSSLVRGQVSHADKTKIWNLNIYSIT